MKGFKYLIGALLFSSVSFSQTNSPCGATPIAVGSACTYTSVNNTGATEENNAANGGTPGCSNLGEDSWYSFVAPASGSVEILSQAGSITDGSLAVYSGPCTAPTEIGCNDDGGPGLMPALSALAVTPGLTYYIRIWDYAGGIGNFDLCIQETPAPPTNVDCASMDPICSGTPITFTAQAGGSSAAATDPGNNYDCLFTSPNPSWYFLEIDTPGDLSIDITAGSDIDYALWGPFTDLANAQASCNTYGLPQDCSYSIAAVEQANVTGVLSGEVYVLLVTNYAATVQSITINEAGGNTASTDCSIVTLPIELIDFTGIVKDRDVELNWITASELNNSHFVLEHSYDGEFWEAIHIAEGQGTTSSESVYSFIHKNASSKLQYYRLKQFDLDGSVFIADVISVSNNSEPQLNIFPQPSKEFITIQSNTMISNISIYSMTGAVVLNANLINTYSEKIDVSNLENGVYIIKSILNDRTVSRKIVIAH